jgi:hypothetical protein
MTTDEKVFWITWYVLMIVVVTLLVFVPAR